MALAVTVNKFASSNVHAVQRKESKTSSATSPAAFPRRGFLLSTLVAAYPLTTDSKTQLLNSMSSAIYIYFLFFILSFFLLVRLEFEFMTSS